MRRMLFLLVASSIPAQSAFAQGETRPCMYAEPGSTGIAAERADHLRVMSLLGGEPVDVLMRRPSRFWTESGDCFRSRHESLLQVTPAAEMNVVANSGYPRGLHSGLMWPGRGVNSAWRAGAHFQLGAVSVGLLPEFAWHQNKAFPIVPLGGRGDTIGFRYPWHYRLDWPQRHGAESFWSAGPGQSYVRVDALGIGAGVSTENLWWGPAARNSILLGNDAPGFPHAFLGTSDEVRTPLGSFRTELIWGRASESLYYDDVPSNDHRFKSGMVVSWTAPGRAGLSIGAGRIFTQAWDSLTLRDFIPFLQSPLKDDLTSPENPLGGDRSDQIAAVYMRWAIPDAGFEVYGEFARNDHSQNSDDFWAEPDHTRAFTLGFQRILEAGNLTYRLQGELTSLGETRTGEHRTSTSFYVHGQGGHTHRGQLLGARIGPGSDAQFLGADVFMKHGRHGIHLERTRYDEDTFYRFVNKTFYMHDVELTAGTTHYVRIGEFDISAGVEYSSRRNRLFRHCNPANGNFDYCQRPRYRDPNWHTTLGVSWRP